VSCKTKAELDEALKAAFGNDCDVKNRIMVSGHLWLALLHLLLIDDDKSLLDLIMDKKLKFTVSSAPGMDTEWQKRVWHLLNGAKKDGQFTDSELADLKRRFIVLLKTDANEQEEPQFACSDFTVIPHCVGFGDSDAAKREAAGHRSPYVVVCAHVTGWTSGTMKNDMGIWFAHNQPELKGDLKLGAAMAKGINGALSEKYLKDFKKDKNSNVWPKDFGQTLRDAMKFEFKTELGQVVQVKSTDEQFVQLIAHVARHSVPFVVDEKTEQKRAQDHESVVSVCAKAGEAGVAADLTAGKISANEAFEVIFQQFYRF
jgi:hypothetical protein